MSSPSVLDLIRRIGTNKLTSLLGGDIIPVYKAGGSLSEVPIGGISVKDFESAVLSQGAPFREQIVATRNGVNNAARLGTDNGRSDTQLLGRKRHSVGRYPVQGLRLGYGQYYITGGVGDVAIANAATFECGVELETPIAVTVPCIFAGARVGNIGVDIPAIFTEPLAGIDVAAGGTFWSRTNYIVAAAAMTIPGSASIVSALGGEVGYLSPAGPTQVPATGAMTLPAGGTGYNPIPPLVILGIPTGPTPAVLGLGDSIMAGNNDTVDFTTAALGFFERGLESVNGFAVPWHLQAVGGHSLQKANLDTGWRGRSLWHYVTHLFCNMATNDIAAGRTLLQIQTDAISLWTAAKRTISPYGKPLKTAAQMVLTRTTSTDSWATAINQTPVAGFTPGGLADQYNAWLLTQVGGPLLDATIDWRPAVQDTATAKWLVNGAANFMTNDGVHPSQVGHIAGAPYVTAWAQTLTC